MSNPRFRREVHAHYLTASLNSQKIKRVVVMVGITQSAIGGGDAGTQGSRQAKPQRAGAAGGFAPGAA